MFKWFQDKINKKRSSQACQQLEIASEAVCDDSISSQLGSGNEEGSSPPDLDRTHLSEPGQYCIGRDSLTPLRERLGDETAGTYNVAYTQGCLATDLLFGPHCSHSSSTTEGEGTPLDIHITQQHSTDSIYKKQCAESTQSSDICMQRPSIQVADHSNSFNSVIYRTTPPNPQTCIGSNIQQSSQKNTNASTLKYGENSCSHKERSCIPREYNSECFSHLEYQKSTLCLSSLPEDKKVTSTPEDFASSDLLDIESFGTIETHTKCMSSTLNHSTGNSQGHEGNTPNAQDAGKFPSCQLELRKKITRPQNQKESTHHIVALTESILTSQGNAESTSLMQNHTKSSIPISNELLPNTSKTQKPREDMLRMELSEIIQKPPEHDGCQCSSNPLNILGKRDVISVNEISLVSAAALPEPNISPKNITGCETQNHHQGRNENQEQEKIIVNKRENNFSKRENLCQMSDQMSDQAVDVLYLQGRNSYEKGNRYSSKGVFSSDVIEENNAHGTMTNASPSVKESVPIQYSKQKLCRDCDTDLKKDDEEIEATVIKMDRFTQTKVAEEYLSSECPSICCLHQACLYNQKGRKCTVLGEHYIMTYLRETPVLVSTSIENSEEGPVGCIVAWVSGKAVEFRELKDGTEVYFDAVVSPKTSSFVTLVIWLNTKPTHIVEPYYNCYIIVELLRNCPIKFVSFAKENGLVSAHISGKRVNVMFSKTVVHFDGQISNVKEIKNLSKSTSQLHGDVLKLMTVDPAGKVDYGYVCSCIWQGSKPLHPAPSVVHDSLKLYRKTPGSFVVASKQSSLICDRNAFLETRGKDYILSFDYEGQLIKLTCRKTIIFSGNLRCQYPVNGKVKVHLRKQLAKGSYTWIVLMVQVHLPLPQQPEETAANCGQLEHNRESAAQLSPVQTPTSSMSNIPLVSTRKSSKSTALPDGTELQGTSNTDFKDIFLTPQCRAREANCNSFNRDNGNAAYEKVEGSFNRGNGNATYEKVEGSFNRDNGNAAYEKVERITLSCNDISLVTEEGYNKKYLKDLTQSSSPVDTNCASSSRKVTYVSGIWIKENLESLVQGKESSDFYNVSSRDDKSALVQVIQNGEGVLRSLEETFILEAALSGEMMNIDLGNTLWVAFDKGSGKWCKGSVPDMLIGFDAVIVNINAVRPVVHVLALWNGKKPLKVCFEGTTYFYDAPGVYHGTNEEGCLKFMVMLEGNLRFITTRKTSLVFEANGDHCASLATFSYVLLHLSMSQGSWTPLLVVLQSKHKHTHLIQEEYSSSCPKSPSLPNLNVAKNCHQTSQCKSKILDTHKTCQVPKVKLTHYLRNLYGTLGETSGKRVIFTTHKNIALSIIIPEGCNVDKNSVGQNIKDIPVGTKLRCDAFCENLKSLNYWAVVVWVVKKPQKSVMDSGSTYYYNVSGRCISSSKDEVSIEIFLENKKKYLVSKIGYVIMPDESFLVLRDLKVGTAIQVNLLQQNEDLCLNRFIYITANSPEGSQPHLLPKTQPEEGNKPSDNVKTKAKIEPGVTEPYLKPSQNINNTKVKFGAADFHPNYSVESHKIAEVKLKVSEPHLKSSKKNLKDDEVKLGSSSQAFSTFGKNEILSSISKPVSSECEYIIVKGTISEPQKNTFTFTDDMGSLTVKIDPLEIAVDLPSCPSSLTGEFYLVYHANSQAGVCGWYQHMAQEVYLQLSMRVFAHNLDNKVLTLGLPDKRSLYKFIFYDEVVVKGNRVQRHEELKSGLIVHPIIEDIKPHLIDGCFVSHRIIFITTVKGVAATCLNFLKHSLLDNGEKKSQSTDKPLHHAVSVNHSLSESSNISSCGDGSGTVHSQVEGGTLTPVIRIGTDTLPKQQICGKGNIETEDSLSKSVDITNVPKDLCHSKITTHSQVVQCLENNSAERIPSVDGETLQKLICARYPSRTSKTHMIQHVILCGKIQLGSSDTYTFSSGSLVSPIELPTNLPHLDISISDIGSRCLMFARKMCPKEPGLVEYQPVVIWPERRQCDPHIVLTYKVVWKRGFLQVIDAADGREKWYLCDYNSVFSFSSSYSICEAIKTFSNQGKTLVLYAVVENIPPLQIQGHLVQGNILFLATSKRMAVASVDIFISSYYEEAMLKALDVPIGQVLHLHRIRVARAVRCKRGTTCYYPLKEAGIIPNVMSVGGRLEAHTDDFAILKCNKSTTTAVCHLSNIFYNGLRITSWEIIPKHKKMNFWAIILPLDETIKEGKWEVDAVSLVAWCCRGPPFLTTHQCYYHVPTLYVPQVESVKIQQMMHLNTSHLEENVHPSPSETFARAVISQVELESWHCQAGSTIFAFHESILQCSDLIKIKGKVTLINEKMILYTSSKNEVVACKISNVFINGRQCQSLKEISDELNQTFTIYACRCPPTTYSGKTVTAEGVIAFIGLLKSIGIHICTRHSCILSNSFLREEITIAEEVFHDISVLCEQSSQWSDYYLLKTTNPEGEIPIPLPSTMKTRNLKGPTLCHGVMIGLDDDSDDQAVMKVTLKPDLDVCTLSVCRSRIMGLCKNFILRHAVGHPFKVILDSMGTNLEKLRILMAWGTNFQDLNVSHNSMDKLQGHDTQRSKSLCCPRALIIKEFQSLFNTDIFEVKSIYKFTEVDKETGVGLFCDMMDKSLITCKVECIVGWPEAIHAKEKIWNLLVPKATQDRKECPEAVGAWQSDCDSLTVGLCNIHGISALNTLCKSMDEIKCRVPLFSPASMGRRNSEPQKIGLPASSIQSSESPNFISAGPNIGLPSIVVEDSPTLSRSLPSRPGLEFSSWGDERNQEYTLNLQHKSDSTALLSIDEGSATEDRKESTIENNSQCDLLNSSYISLDGENENSASIETEEVTPLQWTVTTIKSSLLIHIDLYTCLLIDSTSHIIALLSQGKLYINKVKPKQSFKEIMKGCHQECVNAVVVPLVTPMILGDLRVTHEAVVAWVGSRPPGIGSMINNQNTEDLLYDKTNIIAILQEHVGGFKDSIILSKRTAAMTNPHKGSMWAARPTLRVICAKQEIVSGCTVELYAEHCIILKSIKGFILCDGQLINMGQLVQAVSGTPQAGQRMMLEVLVLELEETIEVFGCLVRGIAAAVWRKDKPIMDDSLIARNLELYKMNWIVATVLNLSGVNKILNIRKGICQSFYELSVLSTHCTLDIIYYCSQDCIEGQYEVTAVLCNHVLLRQHEDVVLALKADVKCSLNTVAEGKCLKVIAVQLIDSFNFCSHRITHFALVVYIKEVKPSRAATIISNWKKGKIERVTSVERRLDSGVVNVNIHLKVDGAAEVKPLSLGILWPLTQKRPEGDMIFAVEGKVYKLMGDCGIMKMTGVTIYDKEIKMIFFKDAVLINNKHLSGDESMVHQIIPALKHSWQCTGQRLGSQERQCVMEKIGEEAQYVAFFVWCEIYSSVQNEHNSENNREEKRGTLTSVMEPGTSLQFTPANAVSTKVGHVAEVHRTVAQLSLENEQLQYVSRDKCFVYGVCLEKVELWHVLSIGQPIEYELTEDENEVKGVSVGGTDSLDSPYLLEALQQWCCVNNVTPSATRVLLMEAGWLPPELTPTVALEENIEVLEVGHPMGTYRNNC